MPHQEHQCLYCFFWRWGKHGCTLGGSVWRHLCRCNEYWLMLICFASMLWCVSIGSRGPGINVVRARITNWTLIKTPLTWCYGHCWHQSLSCSPPPQPPLSSLIIHLLLTFTKWELTRADRRLSPQDGEVTAVNAVPGLEDDCLLWL